MSTAFAAAIAVLGMLNPRAMSAAASVAATCLSASSISSSRLFHSFVIVLSPEKSRIRTYAYQRLLNACSDHIA